MNAEFSMEELFSEAKTLFDDGNSFEEIESKLILKGVDEIHLNEISQKINSYKNNKRLKTGFRIIGMGAAFLLSSCLITLFTDYSNEYCSFALYGLTSIGACILIVGFIFVFG